MSKLLDNVVGELNRLPGVGRRTALRLAMHILKMEQEDVAAMTQSIDAFRINTLCRRAGGRPYVNRKDPPISWFVLRFGWCYLSDAGYRPSRFENRFAP